MANDELLDKDLMDAINEAITQQIHKKKFLFGYHKGYSNSITPSSIEFQFKGVSLSRENDNEAYKYLFNTLDLLLSKAGVRDAVYISSVSLKECDGDNVISAKDFFQKETKNSILLEKLMSDDEVPEKFKCSMTNQIMDKPVSTKHHPDTYYDKSHLIHHFFTQSTTPVDPLCRKSINTYTDVEKNKDLQSEIKQFVAEKLKSSINTRASQLSIASKKYLSGNQMSIASLCAALRQGAAENDLDAVRAFLRIGINIDAKDSNPGSCQTALHLAVKNKHLQMVKTLVDLGARTDIKDAFGKSPAVYALESGDLKMLAIVMGNVDISKAANTTLPLTNKI